MNSDGQQFIMYLFTYQKIMVIKLFQTTFCLCCKTHIFVTVSILIMHIVFSLIINLILFICLKHIIKYLFLNAAKS